MHCEKRGLFFAFINVLHFLTVSLYKEISFTTFFHQQSMILCWTLYHKTVKSSEKYFLYPKEIIAATEVRSKYILTCTFCNCKWRYVSSVLINRLSYPTLTKRSEKHIENGWGWSRQIRRGNVQPCAQYGHRRQRQRRHGSERHGW